MILLWKKQAMMQTMDEKTGEKGLRPEELVPFVREYLGLLEEKRVLDLELRRCLHDYRKARDRILSKRKPIEERFNKVEEIVKKTIVQQKLPGVKYKQYIFTIEEKPVYKPQIDKITEALDRNPVEHFSHDKKTLAKIIVDAVKKKIRDNSDDVKKNHMNMGLKIRVLPS